MKQVAQPEIVSLIYDVVQADPDLSLGQRPETVLIGKESQLSSLSLVSLLIDIETAVQERYGVGITLTDERAFSRQHSPFRTISSLADYVVSLMEQNHV